MPCSLEEEKRSSRGAEKEEAMTQKGRGEYEKKHSSLVSGLVHLDPATRPTDPVALGS